jgi:hypothetical protein
MIVESPGESAALQMQARLVMATLIALIFTGAIRKWVLPGMSILYLLQDVPIGCAYLYAAWTGLYTRGYMMLGVLLLSIIITLQGLAQIIFGGLAPFVAGVGLHNYLFYLPMLVAFPLAFTLKNRNRFIRWNLMLSIPMCALAIAQAQSPKTAWVNHTSEGDAFGVPGAEIARVMGTFNFTVFYGIWVAGVVALCMGEWLLPVHRRAIKSRWLLILCTFSINLCHLVSGSRSAIALAAVAIAGAAMAAAVLGSGRALLAIGGICFLLPVAATATYFISPDEFNIVTERFTGEHYVADGKLRLSDAVIGFATVPQFSLVGAGVGMGVDAAHVGNADTYNFTYQLSEQDMIRNVMELGTPVGLLYALVRLSFAGGMFIFAIRLVKDGSSPHVMPLAFFLFVQVYLNDLTRAATMTASQVMLGYAFILGTYFYPDNASEQDFAGDSLMRSA